MLFWGYLCYISPGGITILRIAKKLHFLVYISDVESSAGALVRWQSGEPRLGFEERDLSQGLNSLYWGWSSNL